MPSTDSEKSFFNKVSVNMVTNVIRVIVMALVGFLMVPYYIDQFGQATYALLPLATSITTYVLITSESLAESFARYLILAIHGNDRDKIDTTYSSSVIGMIRLVLVVMPFVILISILSPFIFNIGEAGQFEVQAMFLLILVSSLLVSFTTCLNSVYMAHNQLYLMYLFRTGYTVIQVAFVIGFFIISGPSLILLGISYLLSSIMLVIALLLGIKKIDPTLKVHKRKYDKYLVKEMTHLGIWAMATRLGNILFIQTSQIIVNICLGTMIQTEFSIVASIISMFMTACSAFTAVGVPLAYKHYNNNDIIMMKGTLDIFTKFTGLILAFPLAYIIIFAPQILTAWLGDTYDNIIPMLYIIIPVCVSRCTIEILFDIPILYKKVKHVAMYTLSTGALNVILALILIYTTDLGVNGVCIAWDVSILVLNFLLIPPFISSLMGINKLTFYKSYVVDYIAFSILVGLGSIITTYWTLPYGWIPIIISILVGFIIYFIIILNIGLNKEEKHIVSTFMPAKILNIISKFAPSLRQ